MCRTDESKIGSYAGRIAPPGMPNMTSTPSDSSDRTRDCAPVRVSTVRAGWAGAAWAALEWDPAGWAGEWPVWPWVAWAWARTPAATVSGEGAPPAGRLVPGVAESDGVLVMASRLSARVVQLPVVRGDT